MKRLFVLFIVILLLCSFSGCYKQTNITGTTLPQNHEQAFQICIPASYCKYAGMEPEDFMASLLDKDEGAIAGASLSGGDVIVEATQTQIDRLIMRNNDNLTQYIESFLGVSNNYRLEGAEDYSAITVYCDEKYGDQNLFLLLAVTTNTYALNNILYNKNPEWDVMIKVVNCHTGRAVIEGSILRDNMSINEKTWEESYNNE